MLVRAILLATILAAGILADTAAVADDGGHEVSSASHEFPRPAAMEPQIQFWRAIFTDYSTHQVVLHDALHLDKVYAVLDFRHYQAEGLSEGEIERLQRVETDLEIERLRATLLRLHGLGAETDTLSTEERKVYDLFGDDASSDRFLAAADEKRLRSQRGLKERFRDGIRVSHRYLPEMERIFRAEGLPAELTRLPLIESCFNLRANSKVGAAGVWQFMPATGRLFMRVDHLVDERRDPIHSTRAAAKYLDRLHDRLDTWPLAITAYNHGPDGLARAVRETGTTDIGQIVRDYRGPSFGFASRNFYAEFLAALDVERDHERHFGDLPLEPPLRAREHLLDQAVGIAVAARIARTDKEELASLNPALSNLVLSGRRPIPRGYRLRVPADGGDGVETRLAELPAEPEVTRVAARTVTTKTAPRAKRIRPAVLTHRVRRGQTLSHIAKQHRVSVATLRSTNRIRKAERLRPGQLLKVPVPQSAM